MAKLLSLLQCDSCSFPTPGPPGWCGGLGSTIRALFQGQLSDDELEKLVEALATQAAIAIQDGKVTYTLTD